MSRNRPENYGPPSDGKWATSGVTVTTLIGSSEQTIELDNIDPYAPFWYSLRVQAYAAQGAATLEALEKHPQHMPRLAFLRGSVDDVPWSATIQSGFVKMGPKQYENGWARLVSLEVGFLAAQATSGGFRLRTAHTTQTQQAHELDDIRGLVTRADYAAGRALDQLEAMRRWVHSVHELLPTRQDVSALPPEDQVPIVASIYNHAVKCGLNARRALVMEATGLSRVTADRRIKTARETGRIRD